MSSHTRNPLEAIAQGAARGAVQELVTTAETTDELSKAYEDRNWLAVGFVSLFGAFYGYHRVGVYNDDATGEDWWVIYANLPTGQVSWHVPVDEIQAFLPKRDSEVYDGHDREEKNDRLAEFTAEMGLR